MSRSIKVFLWNLKSHNVMHSFSGHEDAVTHVALSPDGRYVVSAGLDKTVRVWDLKTGNQLHCLKNQEEAAYFIEFKPDGHVLTTDMAGKKKAWELTSGKAVDPLFLDQEKYDNRFGLKSTYDRVVLWDSKKSQEVASLLSFDNGIWAVVDRDGRYDSNSPGDLPALSWMLPDDPLRPLPVEIFMKEYYEPRLLPRILAGEKFQPVKGLTEINRVQPVVKINKIGLDPDNPDRVVVAVEVAEGKKESHRNGKGLEQKSGVYDLRLFRDGQLVGYEPKSSGRIHLTSDAGRKIIKFSNIRFPHNKNGGEIEFSAYAFNVDGIKSGTDKMKYVIPKQITIKKSRAYIISIGVNAYENPAWDLQYAANDAHEIQRILTENLSQASLEYEDIVPVLLVSESRKTSDQPYLSGKLPDRKNIRGVFELLAGRPISPLAYKNIPNADRIQPATPDDLIVISYSGHGYANSRGDFYIFPYDIGPGEKQLVSDVLLEHTISSEDLSLWLRDVDAGDMVMIIDACNSAAGVEGKGFKPGPMGSRGLGQLAFDKGMRILTASQADSVALESDLIKHGILTYALLREGIEAGKADQEPRDSRITVKEWLAFGESRVPKLYGEIRNGELEITSPKSRKKGRIVYLKPQDKAEAKKLLNVQKPGLFDFTRKNSDVVIVVFQ